MTKRVRDTDYLYISARIKVLEKNMLSPVVFSRLAAAESEGEACKILAESGWPEIEAGSAKSLEGAISRKRAEMLELLYRYSPDSRVIDIFRLKYDYHNLKAYVKASARNTDYTALLTDAGTIPAARLISAIADQSPGELDPNLYNAGVEAVEVLMKTRDPQLSDILLDRAMARQMLETADKTKSSFLQNYVKMYIDGLNLLIACRAYRVEKGADYLEKALIPGGNISVSELILENGPDMIEKLFGQGAHKEAAKTAVTAIRESLSLEALDKACDNVLLEYIAKSRFVPFGEAQVISYLLLVENELVCVRVIMAGHRAGYSEEKIMGKLRLGYYQ